MWLLYLSRNGFSLLHNTLCEIAWFFEELMANAEIVGDNEALTSLTLRYV